MRIEAMSTAALQQREKQLDSQIAYAKKVQQQTSQRLAHAKMLAQAAAAAAQLPDLSSAFASGVTPAPKKSQGSGASKSTQTAQRAAQAYNQLSQSIIQMQSALSPTTAAYAQYNKTVADAHKEAEAMIAANPRQTAQAHAMEAAVQGLAAARLKASLADAKQQAQLKQSHALQDQANVILQQQAREVQEVQAEQQAGLITEYTARQKIIAIHHRSADALQEIVDKYLALARATGNPQIIQNAENLAAHVERLKLSVNDATKALKSGFEGGLESALEGLATRTMTVRQAFVELAQSVARSLAQVAARALASKATDAISSLLGHGKKSSSIGEGATKLAGAGAAVAAGGAVVMAAATSLMAAATALKVTQAFGGGGGAGGSSLSGIASMALNTLFEFDEGGYTGAGGKHQVAGIVHAGEGVLSQADMAALGGPVGFAALRYMLRGYADGGYVHPLANAPSPADLGFTAPAPLKLRMPEPAQRAAAPAVGVRIVNAIDEDYVINAMQSSAGETLIKNVIARNATLLKQTVKS